MTATYTPRELAAILKIGRSTVYAKAKTGEWPSWKLSPRCTRFTEEHLARILAMHEAKPPPTTGRPRRTRHSYP